jgi:hypothetical protein
MFCLLRSRLESKRVRSYLPFGTNLVLFLSKKKYSNLIFEKVPKSCAEPRSQNQLEALGRVGCDLIQALSPYFIYRKM